MENFFFTTLAMVCGMATYHFFKWFIISIMFGHFEPMNKPKRPGPPTSRNRPQPPTYQKALISVIESEIELRKKTKDLNLKEDTQRSFVLGWRLCYEFMTQLELSCMKECGETTPSSDNTYCINCGSSLKIKSKTMPVIVDTNSKQAVDRATL